MDTHNPFTRILEQLMTTLESYYRSSMLLVIIGVMFALPGQADAAITYTISKSHNAPTPIASGQPFTYTITYSWSGGAPGTLYIQDDVPATLDVLSALPSSPVSTISGNTVNFAITGLTLPSGSGTVQINARFKPGVTCEGVRAINVAGITDDLKDDEGWVWSDETLVISDKPVNKWTFSKDLIAGCALNDEVIYRICIQRPAGSDIGGLNLYIDSLQDLLPANAVLLSVYSSWGGPNNVVSTGNWIDLTGGPSILYVSPYAGWYCAYVKVKYDSAFFAAGQTVANIARLKYHTPCDTTIQEMSDTVEVELCEGVSDGYIWKGLSLSMYFPNNPMWTPTFSPDCCGTYRVAFKNNGTLALDTVIIKDEIPGHVEVNAIKTNVPSANLPVTVDVYTWNAGVCQTTPSATFTYTTGGFKTETTLPADICKVEWTYSNSLAVNDWINNYLDVCVLDTNFKTNLPVLPGQTITNTATAEAVGFGPISINHNKDVDTLSPHVVATKLFTGDCGPAPGCTLNQNGPFMPGDTVRYRLAVANIGNADATTATITDNLPTGASYAGNETYFYGAFAWMVNPWNPSCCDFNTTVPTQIGGTITPPSLGDTNLVWSFPVLPARCDGTVEFFLIEFDVVLDDAPPMLAGQHPNHFVFDASNVPTVTSNTAWLTVNAIAQVQAQKEVRPKGSSTWTPSAGIPAGSIAEYRLSVTNTGNTPLLDLCMLDIMPWVGDITVLPPYSPRNSTFSLPYNPADGAITMSLGGFTDTYNTLGPLQQQNPSRISECGGFCGATDPAGATVGTFGSAVNTYSYKINANSGISLAPGATLEVIVPAKVNQQTELGLNACNSFAMQARPEGIPNVCLSTESNPACIEVTEKVECLEIKEPEITCVGIDEKGNIIYQVNTQLYSNVGTTTNIQLTSPSASILGYSPTTLANVTWTPFTAQFTTNASVGEEICFVIVLMDKEQNILCEERFCVIIPDCPEPCPCPFDIKVGKNRIYQSTGNLIGLSNSFSIGGTGIQNIKATVVSAVVTETCWWGGSSTYNAAATFQSATNWGPVAASGVGTSSINWQNLACPQVNNFGHNMMLDVPTAPRWGCYQTVKICIRYEFTDCKCNICDTVVCFEVRRKARPIIWFPWELGQLKGMVAPNSGDAGNGIIQSSDVSEYKGNKDRTMAGEDNQVAFITMNSTTEGTLTINNPNEDEFTSGISIISLYFNASDGIKVSAVNAEGGSWSQGETTPDGLRIKGLLAPGMVGKFSILYENPSNLPKWTNMIGMAYTVEGSADTLYGMMQLTSRVPSAMGGDELVNENPGNNVENARTFALRFTNSNTTKDSIDRIVLSVNDGSILAIGPGLEDNTIELESYRGTSGEITLLAAAPAGDKAVTQAIPADLAIGPMYITVASENETSIVLAFTTYGTDGSIITENEVELTNPVLGVGEQGIFIDHINSSFYPNPASNEVNVKFDLFSPELVTFQIRALNGKVLATVIDSETMSSGEHNVTFQTLGLPSGTYYYTIETATERHVQKFVIVK